MSSFASMPTDRLTLAIDVGNTSIQLGQFEQTNGSPSIVSMLRLSSRAVCDGSFDATQLAAWIPDRVLRCFSASVFREAHQQLWDWLRRNRPELELSEIRSEDFPIASCVDDPASVGADRVAAAVAANALRRAGHGVIVVDSGTAITVDAVDADGQFLGGAIAPGWRMSADALHRVADQLPLVAPTEQQPPPIGTNTVDAVRSGLYWGAVGLVRELVDQLKAQMKCDCDILITGGGADMLARHLPRASACPELVLAGIVIAGHSQA